MCKAGPGETCASLRSPRVSMQVFARLVSKKRDHMKIAIATRNPRSFDSRADQPCVTFAWQVGLLDVDICGPSVPRMLGLTGQEVHQSSSGWSPVWVNDDLGVMSIGFMLPQQDNAVIWRGPRKNGLIKQFLTVRVPPRRAPRAAACSFASRFPGGSWL